ncbi:MAG: pseudouridine synthase [Staphylothermus sp.]|nr:pseudouridine synthase [Staphylothermus sp.]
MHKRKATSEELEELRWIASLQFGEYGIELIPDNITLVISPSTGKIRYLLYEDKLYLSLRAGDHRFLLHIPSARVLNRLAEPPKFRVYVNINYAEFIKNGGNVFSKHVVMADPEIRPGDEVVVVDENGELIGVGRAIRPGWEMIYYNWGEAVRIREGVQEEYGSG